MRSGNDDTNRQTDVRARRRAGTGVARLAVFLVFLSALTPGAADLASESDIVLEAGLTFTDVHIDGKGPYRFVLDTGATETTLSPRLAASLGLAASFARATRVNVASLRAGGLETRHETALVYEPPEALSLRIDHGIDYRGLLGYPFLSRRETRIDYPRRKLHMTLLPPVPPVPQRVGPDRATDPSFTAIRLTPSGHPLVPAMLNGRGPYQFLLDTGSAEVLVLPETAQKAGLTPGTATPAGVAPPRQRVIVSVGPYAIPDVEVLIHRLPRDRTPEYEGIIGTPFLRHFAVTLNYRDRWVRFKVPHAVRP